jgi:hypothetical protein
MRVDTRPRKRNAPRIAEKSAPGFLQWLRGRECYASCRLAADGSCDGKIEAAHVDYAGGKGVGTKVADRYAIPLCAAHHRLQHDRGWKWFDVNMLAGAGQGLEAAEQFWFLWPGRIAWERKLEERA